ncbi:MAG: LUD domain-containing protein [Candidatus Limimorpha sp.]
MKRLSFGNLNESTNKEQILAKVRNAVMGKDENNFSDVNMNIDTWTPFNEEDGVDFTFIERFKNNGGIFIYFENKKSFIEALKQYIVDNQWDIIHSTSSGVSELLESNDIVVSKEYDIRERKITSFIECECLIAQTGSIVVTDRCAGSRMAYSMSEVLLVYATPNQIVANIKDANNILKEKYGDNKPTQTVIISGASRSMEFDNNFVSGAQGIKQLALFLVDEDEID